MYKAISITIWNHRLGGGGAERVIADLAQEFSCQGHNVTAVVHSYKNEYYNANSGFPLINLGRYLPKFFKPRTLFCLFGLLKHIYNKNPDIIFTTGLYHNLILLLVKKIFRLPICVIIRETNTLTTQYNQFQSRKEKILLKLIRWLYPSAGHIICPSQGVKKDLQALIPEIKKITVIHNPINYKLIVSAKNEPLPDITLKKEGYIVGVGRLVPHKRFDLLIQAWAPIYHEIGLKLVLLGEGPHQDNLQQLARSLKVEKGLIFAGFDANPFKYMAKAKLFVLSSDYEGLPNVLIQAMVCGVPVISSNCPSGPSEILNNGEYGLLFPVGDLDALHQAIKKQLNAPLQPPQWKEMKEKFGLQQITQQYLDIFYKKR